MSKRKSKQQKHPTPSRPDRSITTLTHAEYSGPIPPPNILAGYEEIHPGFADRIIKMAETETAHRHEMEERALEAEIESRNQEEKEISLGQVFAFILGLVTIISGSITAIKGAQVAGGFIGTGGVIGLVSVFIYGRKGKPSPVRQK
jgi:uncharacterized membrane protein